MGKITDMLLIVASAALAFYTATTLCLSTNTCYSIVKYLVLLAMVAVAASLLKDIARPMSK